MMDILFGTGDYRYRVVEGWGRGLMDREVGGRVAGVAVDSKDRVYAICWEPAAVLSYDREGRFLTSWGEDLFINPHGIYLSDEDEVYVTDAGEGHTMRKFSTDGQLLQTLGTPGQPGAPGMPFNKPSRAVLSPSGDLFVSDGYGQNRVHRFSAKGDLLFSWGSKGTGPGQFDLPHSIWVDRREWVLVADRGNDRIQIFDVSGAFLHEWADVDSPNGIFVDQNDVVYIAEARQRISMFDLDGKLLGRWGDKGVAPGQFRDHVHGLWIDSHGDLYVSEVSGGPDRLQKFERVRDRRA